MEKLRPPKVIGLKVRNRVGQWQNQDQNLGSQFFPLSLEISLLQILAKGLLAVLKNYSLLGVFKLVVNPWKSVVSELPSATCITGVSLES